MTERIRVLLIDSSALFRQCLAAMLIRGRRLEIVGQSASGSDGLAQAQAVAPDVVIVDPAVQEGGPSLVAQLTEQAPEIPVIILTAPGAQPGAVAQLLEHGARGYLDKDCDVRAVAQCIERVRAGEVVITSLPEGAHTKGLFGSRSDSGLTPRELDVVRAVADGGTNAEIAQSLYISEHTVKSHLAKMLRKLGFANRAQLANYAAHAGVTEFSASVPNRAASIR